MSARLLNKVLKEREQQKQHVIEEEEQLNGGESESPDSGARSSVNPFDLLNEGDDEDEGNPDQV